MYKIIKEDMKISAYLAAAVGAVSSLLLVGTVTYHFLEKWSWIDALYFTVVTLATVGYGDLHPSSDGSRLFTIFFILIGVTISVTSIAVIGGRYLAKKEEELIREREAKTIQKYKNG